MQSWRHHATQQKRTCKIMQDCARILHARLAWHVYAICPFSCMILALSCKILHIIILQEMVQETPNLQVIILAASLARCSYVHARSCKIVQESCKKRDISRACAMQVLHARFLHNLVRILHDLASSFLLGSRTELKHDACQTESKASCKPGKARGIMGANLTTGCI